MGSEHFLFEAVESSAKLNRTGSERSRDLGADDDAVDVATVVAHVIPVEATHGRGGAFAASSPSLVRKSASKARISGAMALLRSASSRG